MGPRIGLVEVRGDEVDPLAPVRITHGVDEIIADGVLEQHYNYLVYEFEQDGWFATARTYVDEIRKVAIYGPFESRNDATSVDAPEFEAAVLTYLKRRFQQIERLDTAERSSTGYVTVWRASGR